MGEGLQHFGGLSVWWVLPLPTLLEAMHFDLLQLNAFGPWDWLLLAAFQLRRVSFKPDCKLESAQAFNNRVHAFSKLHRVQVHQDLQRRLSHLSTCPHQQRRQSRHQGHQSQQIWSATGRWFPQLQSSKNFENNVTRKMHVKPGEKHGGSLKRIGWLLRRPDWTWQKDGKGWKKVRAW